MPNSKHWATARSQAAQLTQRPLSPGGMAYNSQVLVLLELMLLHSSGTALMSRYMLTAHYKALFLIHNPFMLDPNTISAQLNRLALHHEDLEKGQQQIEKRIADLQQQLAQARDALLNQRGALEYSKLLQNEAKADLDTATKETAALLASKQVALG